jgi:hypothetical protein
MRDLVCELEHRARTVRADVEHLAVGGGYERRACNDRRHVVDVREGARLQSVPEHGERLAAQGLVS